MFTKGGGYGAQSGAGANTDHGGQSQAHRETAGHRRCGVPGLRIWLGAKGEKRWQIRRPNGKLQILPFQGTTLEEARHIASQPEQALPVKTTPKVVGPLLDAYIASRGEVWATTSRRPRMIRIFLEPSRPPDHGVDPRLDQRPPRPDVGYPHGFDRRVLSQGCLEFRPMADRRSILPKSPFRRLRRLPVTPHIGALTKEDSEKLKRRCWTFSRSPAVAPAPRCWRSWAA